MKSMAVQFKCFTLSYSSLFLLYAIVSRSEISRWCTRVIAGSVHTETRRFAAHFNQWPSQKLQQRLRFRSNYGQQQSPIEGRKSTL